MNNGTELKGILGHINKDYSEALEMLEDISKEEIVVRDRSSVYMNPNDNGKGAFIHLTTVGVNFKGAIETIKQELLKAQEQEKECDDNLTFENGKFMSGFGYKGKQIVAMPLDAYSKLMEQEKVLNVIKEKNVDTKLLRECNSVDEYNAKIKKDYNSFYYKKYRLTQEEFDLLKRYYDEKI